MQIGVVGMFHLGCVVTAGFAECGHTVVVFEETPDLAAKIRAGRAPLFEPGLDAMLQRHLRAGSIWVTSEPAALARCSVLAIAYDTPVDDEDRGDPSAIFAAVGQLASSLADGCLVLVLSQLPVGACDRLAERIRSARGGRALPVVYSPENLQLGRALESFLEPERIVIGADDAASLEAARAVFAPVGAPVLAMNRRSAEMAKQALNAFLATSISFANEIARLAESAGGIDIGDVMEALRTDARIGPHAYLQPGPGFAGGTLARDVQALIGLASGEAPARLLPAVLAINREQKGVVLERLRAVYERLDGLEVAVYGLTYKAGTSTLRRSASVEIIRDLTAAGVRVDAYDPKVAREEVAAHPEFRFVDDPYRVCEAKDAAIFITEWPEFRTMDFRRMLRAMRRPVIVDARNMLDGEQLLASGAVYLGIGKGSTAG